MKKYNLKFLFIFAMFFCLIKPASALHKDKAQVYFMGTGVQDNAVLVRTEMEGIPTGKTILYDTGKKSTATVDKIYQKAFAIQYQDPKNNGKIAKIDYMIISHLDDDHYGNAKDILTDSRFYVEKLIIKNERLKTSIYNDIVKTAKNRGTKIVNIEGKSSGKITISDSVVMHLYNLQDVYANKSECGTENNKKKGYIIKFRPKQEKKGNTIYNEDGTQYYKTLDGKKFYGYLYNDQVLVCRSNANSIAALFEVSTDAGKKYIYLTGDLDNNGYSVNGATNAELGKIYGTGATYFYTSDKMYIGSNKTNTLAKKNSAVVKNVQAKSEALVAAKIKKQLGSNVNNIVVYQQSHHGQNNSQEAITMLNLNRSSVYAVANTVNVPDRSSKEIAYEVYKSAFVTLSKAKKMYTKNTGVACTISYTGSTVCQ